jgi:hypothetical protein
LFTTPVIYLYLDRFRKHFTWSTSRRPGFLIPGGTYSAER